MITLVERILNEMNTDVVSFEECSDGLEDIYMCATPNERLMIDRCFINLCGWRLKTLLNKIRKERGEDEL